MNPIEPGDAEATLADWRARGAQRHDPVQFRFIEALVRRAAAHTGAARRRLDERAAALIAAYAARIERAQPAAPPARAARQPAAAPAPRTPLAELVEALARHAGAGADALARSAPAGAFAELQSVRRFNATWTRLAADHRLAQSLEQVPANAGPLNSQHLAHQALALMREVSPAYLGRFLAQVDALLWLEQKTLGAKAAPAARARS